MATSIDWGTKIITVPRADMTLVQSMPTEIRELSLNNFRLDLKALEADKLEGSVFQRTHNHNTEVLLGGIVYARVIEMINGYTVTFEDGQYAVNLTGANSNVGDVVNVNQVSVRSQNSAGLISNQAIEFSSFNGGVTVDIDNLTGIAQSGTVFPIGTAQAPSDNLSDAALIASRRGLGKIYIVGNLTLSNEANWTRFSFVGESSGKTTLTVNTEAIVDKTEYYDMTIQGVFDGDSLIVSSVIKDIEYINGIVDTCMIGSVIKLGPFTQAHLLHCTSGVPGTSTPVVDFDGQNSSLAVRNYNGGLSLRNKTSVDAVSIDLSSGQIILESSVVAGQIVVRGIGKLIDTLGNPILTGNWNGATIINELLTAGDTGGGSGEADWTTNEKKQMRDALGIDGDKRVARDGQLQEKSEQPNNDIINTNDI